MKTHSTAVNFAPHALVARSVLPVAVTIMLWGALIEGVRLLAQAF